MAQQVEDARATQEQRFRMSYEEFMEWDNESIQAEWVNGEVTVFMPPTTLHQRVSLLLSTLLALYARSFNLGEVIAAPFEMRLWPGRSSREPDILFLAREHEDELTPKRLEGPADLVVEFISDSSVARDRDDKFYEYQEAGVREYWIIDPRPGKQRADFYQLTPRGTYQTVLADANGHYHAAVLPGFWFDPDWLRQEPLPDAVMLLAQIAPRALRDALKAVDTPPNDE